jgi:hypothetical protein
VALFEVAVFVVAAALGWAAFRTYTALNAFHQRPIPAPAEIQPAEDIVETLPAADNRNPQDLQEILKLSALIDLKDRYADLADQLEPGLAELRDALQSFLRDKDRGEIARYRRKSQALESWIRKQHENIDLRKQQMLRDCLRSSSSSISC